MTDDLLARLDVWKGEFSMTISQYAGKAVKDCTDAAARIREQSSQITRLREALDDLIIDVENKYGDPHTLSAAKEALRETEGKP